MNRGRPIPPLEITEQEREELVTIVHHRRSKRAEIKRAKVILLCAAGHSNSEVSRRVDVCSQSVGQWRRCFLKGRVKGLTQGPARRIDSAKANEVIRLTLESSPTSGKRWSTRALAKKIGLSHASIASIWESFGLKPHPQEGFQLSTDPFLVQKVHDIVGLYMSPVQHALVICVGGQRPDPIVGRNNRVFPSGLPDRVEPRNHDDYQRILSLFGALAIGTGGVYARHRVQHTQPDFPAFLSECEGRTPGGFELHIVLDNHATERTLEMQQWLARHPRGFIHLIPARSSWLHQVERFFGELTQSRFVRTSIRSLDQLCIAMLDYIDTRGLETTAFHWCASLDPDCDKAATPVDRVATRLLEVVS